VRAEPPPNGQYPVLRGTYASVEDLEVIAIDDETGAEVALTDVIGIRIEARLEHPIVAHLDVVDPLVDVEALRAEPAERTVVDPTGEPIGTVVERDIAQLPTTENPCPDCGAHFELLSSTEKLNEWCGLATRRRTAPDGQVNPMCPACKAKVDRLLSRYSA